MNRVLLAAMMAVLPPSRRVPDGVVVLRNCPNCNEPLQAPLVLSFNEPSQHQHACGWRWTEPDIENGPMFARARQLADTLLSFLLQHPGMLTAYAAADDGSFMVLSRDADLLAGLREDAIVEQRVHPRDE